MDISKKRKDFALHVNAHQRAPTIAKSVNKQIGKTIQLDIVSQYHCLLSFLSIVKRGTWGEIHGYKLEGNDESNGVGPYLPRLSNYCRCLMPNFPEKKTKAEPQV
jgi:hypothetical protein